MTWVFAILLVLALGGIAAVAAGRGAPMAPKHDDRPEALVPASRPLTAADVRAVRFSLGFRGYRMSEVDALLRRVAAEMERRPGLREQHEPPEPPQPPQPPEPRTGPIGPE